jgi:hypothetical protein
MGSGASDAGGVRRSQTASAMTQPRTIAAIAMSLEYRT